MREENSFVLAHDLDDKLLDLNELLILPQLQDIGAKHAVYHVMAILSPLKEILKSVTHSAVRAHTDSDRSKPKVPFMGEFLDFIWFDKSYILRKKKWP